MFIQSPAIEVYKPLKGQSHEIFNFWFFFNKHLPLGHCFMPQNVSAYNFEFTEIF
jgi:hypothetical protein